MLRLQNERSYGQLRVENSRDHEKRLFSIWKVIDVENAQRLNVMSFFSFLSLSGICFVFSPVLIDFDNLVFLDSILLFVKIAKNIIEIEFVDNYLQTM